MANVAIGVVARHWVYLDEARSHEVHAEVETSPREDRLVTTEFPAGSRDPAEIIQSARRVASEADVARLVGELESRLSLAGRYYRADAADMKWQPLAAAAADGRVELRGFELPVPGGEAKGSKMAFHHFHAASGEDKLLISMPRVDADPTRHALAELSFRFPRVDTGDLTLVHPRLTSATLRSALAQRHLELPREGYSKLLDAQDYRAAFGDAWQQHARGMFDAAATRMMAPRSPTVPPAQLLTRGDRDTPELLHEVVRALASRRVAELRQRYLTRDDTPADLDAGEHIIRRTIAAKRRAHPHTAAYDLSVLEAALLCDYAVRHDVGSLVQEEGLKLLRFAHGYA